MNVREIMTRVQRQFGDESGAQITEDDILRWCNDGQLDIARRTECLQSHAETSSAADDGSYELPDEFMFARRVTFDNILLHRIELETLDGMHGTYRDREGAFTGEPESYYIWGHKLYIYPAPSAPGVGNLDIFFVRTPALLRFDTDVPEIPLHMHEDLVRYCLTRAKELDEDWDAAKMIGGEYDARVLNARHETKDPYIDTYPAVRLIPGDW